MEPQKSLLEFIPINRKEKYYTGTVLPMIVCRDNIRNISRIFKLAGIDVEGSFEELDDKDVIFYTEYSLKDSCVGCFDQSFLNTLEGIDKFSIPDILIGARFKDRFYILAVEAKMFQKTSFVELSRQLKKQLDTAISPVVQCLKMYYGSSAEVIVEQCALLPEQMIDFNKIYGQTHMFKVISWEDILTTFSDNNGCYFYRILQRALEEYDDKISKKSLDI